MSFTQNQSKIKKLFTTLDNDEEFEIMFNNYKPDNKLSMNKFKNVLKYLKWKSSKDNLELGYLNVLDVIYNYENNNSYRVSIIGKDKIEDFCKSFHLKPNNELFSILISQFSKEKNFKLIKKVKNRDKIIDIDDYDIRFRISKEQEIDNKIKSNLTNLPSSEADKIIFRYKNRVSLNISKDTVIDLTVVKTSKNIDQINRGTKSFELEIDYSKDSKKHSEKELKLILDETENLKKVIEESSIIITKDEIQEVQKNYKKLVYGSENSLQSGIYNMKPVSAEVQHIIEKIPNRYSVTDKADGSNNHLYINNNNIYLISSNLNVKKVGKTSGLDQTIIEGELIHLSNINKYLYLSFDCLFFKGEDMRTKLNLKDRLEKVYQTCKKLTNTSYKYKEFETKSGKEFNLDEEKKIYQKEIVDFYNNLNGLIKKAEENDIIYHPKLFIFPKGALNSEVFLFSYLIWYNCTRNEKINCPYSLDGIIYTGVEQKYTKDKKEQKYPIYKYKPPEMNSLDVYIEFQTNRETGGYLEIFDNSLPESVENQNFRVTNFYVGDNMGNREVPVPFMKESDNHEAFLPITNGQVRDVEGNIVQDKTVIEIVYNNDPLIPHPYRWQVLRTRWDKTDSVIKNNKKYGNFKDVAIRVWKSMIEAVTIEELKNLANPDNYIYQKKQLEIRLKNSDIAKDTYYEKTTDVGKIFRQFNNWIKSVIIYTYGQKKLNKAGDLIGNSVLDIGCGRGGDLLKMYHARIKYYVGVDPSYENLNSVALKGAIPRYQEFKKKFPDFGKFYFVQGDLNALLNVSDQEQAISKMSSENKNLIERLFKEKQQFDIINAGFSIHYLFGSKLTVNNLIENINYNLKPGGYILMTLFDGEIVYDLLKDNHTYTSFYTDDEGKKKKYFEIIKKFENSSEDKLKNEPGQAIDVYMSWISDEGKYNEEYLISKKLMTKTMKKANCKLVETDTFENVYHQHYDYFTKVIDYEENPKNKKFYKEVAKFFGDLKGIDKESKKYAFLNRYYVFQKLGM